MIPAAIVTDLSRMQFAFTALFHFLFVPLTLGLTWVVVMMEAAYLITGKDVYKDMTKFWGKLLGINFAIGVISGLTMEFEFGLNWSYFSRLIGGSFGPILAIEGITAFMLEATMFGLFYFTWDKLSRGAHFVVTLFMAIGASLSIVNILAANSWMQHPTHTSFNYMNMTMELHSILGLYLNHLSQIRVGHVLFAGFMVSSVFVMGISAFYLLRRQDIGFAKRSFAVGAGFAFVTLFMVAFFGDQNGLIVSKYEPEKMAAIEAQWNTQKPPAAWYVIAFPNQAEEKNYFTVKIPYALSLIATHSLTGTVEGAKPIIATYRHNVERGVKAYAALMKIWANQATPADKAIFEKNKSDIGFALLLKRYLKDPSNATPAQITMAAKDAIPNFEIAFWSFRFMVGIWLLVSIIIIAGFVYTLRGTLSRHRWYLRAALYAIPLPYLAAEFGWILAEVGRQPWVIHKVLPTFLGTSSLSMSMVLSSLILFVLFYGTLISVELFLMFRFARKGPSCLGTGRYHFESEGGAGGQS